MQVKRNLDLFSPFSLVAEIILIKTKSQEHRLVEFGRTGGSSNNLRMYAADQLCSVLLTWGNLLVCISVLLLSKC